MIIPSPSDRLQYGLEGIANERRRSVATEKHAIRTVREENMKEIVKK